ncbi:dynein light intermediate chain-domain-containing protein [Leucosporidium creatinivorum]|uniref:Dynein light intermediate chain-domain-containing protein n=1 Tax=Leucosporidium creatinivorum TaxID=106004 RepID=A0A1Y2G2V2_9BASI|nr:dynein light intermediate chain-domain-containing protein [Leucosporidium creatinivorum]
MDALPTSPTSPTSGAAPTRTTAAGGAGAGEDAQTDLWSSILDSVSGSRGVTTKNCIVLGGHNSGKSTLISRLGSRTGEATSREVDGNAVASGNGKSDVLDLGLSYSVLDVGDEADEETLARLGIYQLPSPSPPYPSLLSLALSRATLLDSLVVVVLDWERPWHFLRDLRAWMAVLEERVRGRGGIGEGWEGQEGRDRLEAHLKAYVEPTSGSATTTTGPSASQLADIDGPLEPGVLTDNLGLGLVFVCTKADHLDTLERDNQFKEEQYDFVQQCLRTIALRYGAAVFFTSHTQPTSFAKLRSYILHRLFTQPPTTTAITSSSIPAPLAAGAPPSTSSSRSFPFPYRANVVDREEFLIPAGWDSWGKIKIHKERFDAEGLAKGWESDLEAERERLAGKESVEDEQRLDEEGRPVVGALLMFEQMLPNEEMDRRPLAEDGLIKAEDEQSFLKVHLETIQKERASDPRAAFRPNPNSVGGAADSGVGAGGFPPSLVGPMASGGLNLPNVEKALGRDREKDRELDDPTAARRASIMSRKDSAQSARTTSPNLPFSTPGNTGSNNTSPNLPFTPGGSSTAPGTPGGPGQNEILHNFFQGLLAARGNTPSASSGSGAAGAGSARPPSSTSGVSPTLGQSARGAPGMGSRSSSHQSGGGGGV